LVAVKRTLNPRLETARLYRVYGIAADIWFSIDGCPIAFTYSV